MRLLLALTFFVALALAPTARAAEKDALVYEMRTYTPAKGKMDALHARFKNHTLKLFEKHGITSVAYFTPQLDKESKLIFFLSYSSKDAREKSWKAFVNDAD